MESNRSPMSWVNDDELTGLEHFGKRLKKIIGKQSVLSFAKDCNLSDASVRKYLNSGTMPGIDTVAAISAHTGCSLTWLITGEGEPHIDKTGQVSNRLPDEEIAKWWNTMTEALRVEDRINIITAFQYGGLNAVFKPDLITDNPLKPKARQ
ncbi:XRE family transcriptional regulator [Salmonella enterica subsp. enterica]|nr:helix-turn-helix transcriptional regulator [Salmonella enterica subsp. enterica]EDW1097498.1 helix-turn-helix transcriptional regulator [Salmonella enterica subsp. enterica]MIM34111.1 XRE family transcriptional regulator [Salmonella enterica subsp. enterica]